MRRRLESLLPAIVLLGFLVTTVVVNLLLTSAEERGVEALEESVSGEVQAIAASQNQRFINTFSSASGLSSGLGGDPFELVVGSTKDRDELEDLLALVADTRSGFYLLDATDTITQGVLLPAGALGTTFEWPGLEEFQSSEAWARGGVLPVAAGLTTEEPVVPFLLPIYEKTAAGQGPRRGTFVYETIVAIDSNFNKEIGELKRGDTGEYFFFDTAGTVVASNDPSMIGEMLDDDRMLTSSAGLQRFGEHIVVLADVPTAGWRVAFRQDVDEFEGSLAGPLESVGRLLILALLSGGFIVTALLFRRLRVARAEQERLRRLSEAQQEFISIVSHELRTPVAGVLGFLETSIDHWDSMGDDERKLAVTRAANNARRLQAMTRDVLDTQRIESGQLVHVFGRLDLAEEVRVAVEAARELDRERSIEVDAPDEPVWVDGDADRLQQVLANLLDNARKNSPSTEPIEVRLVPDGTTAEVAITDRGPGIADESLERIFDKFVRGRGDSVSGTGLGLYISRQIIDAHRGRIWAESEPGHGSTFRFVLPIGADEAQPASTSPDG